MRREALGWRVVRRRLSAFGFAAVTVIALQHQRLLRRSDGGGS